MISKAKVSCQGHLGSREDLRVNECYSGNNMINLGLNIRSWLAGAQKYQSFAVPYCLIFIIYLIINTFRRQVDEYALHDHSLCILEVCIHATDNIYIVNPRWLYLQKCKQISLHVYANFRAMTLR